METKKSCPYNSIVLLLLPVLANLPLECALTNGYRPDFVKHRSVSDIPRELFTGHREWVQNPRITNESLLIDPIIFNAKGAPIIADGFVIYAKSEGLPLLFYGEIGNDPVPDGNIRKLEFSSLLNLKSSL